MKNNNTNFIGNCQC